MADLISRQAVKELAHNQVREKYYDMALKEDCDFYIKLADIIIDLLPSAQPEIIRCKDCKHHWTHKCMDSMPIERCDLEQTFYDAEVDYCSLAERRINVRKEVKK